MKKFNFLSLVIVLAFTFITSSVVLAGWTDAPPSPPNDNAKAPINVSDLAQMKTGSFAVGGFFRALSGLVVGGTNSAAEPEAGYSLDITGNALGDDFCVRGMPVADCLRSLANRVTILEGGTVTNTCTSFTYNTWTPATCTVGQTQTRTVKTKGPSGCSGGSPVISQTCNTPAKYALTVVVVGSGNVTMSPTGGSYAPGTTVSLTATPGLNAKLDLWSLDGMQQADGRTNPYRVTMDKDKAVTVTFSSVVVPPPFDGTVITASGGLSQGAVCPSNQAAFKVTGEPIFEKNGSVECVTLKQKNPETALAITKVGTTVWAKDIISTGFACPSGQVITGLTTRICGLLNGGCLLPEHQWQVQCGRVGDGILKVTTSNPTAVSGAVKMGAVFSCPANKVLTKVSGTCNNTLCGTFTAHGECSTVTLSK
jgi:hypothetical protein